MHSVLSISPSTNHALSSPAEREDAMTSFARVLMGLSYPLQLVGQGREILNTRDWHKPPQLRRRWLAVVSADNEATLAWRTRTLSSALDGVGLKCGAPGADDALTDQTGDAPIAVKPGHVRTPNSYASSLVLRRWPREVAPGWLGQALATDLPVDVGIHVQPQDPQRIARFLKRQQAWQTDTGPRQDAGNQIGRDDAERVRMKLIARTDRPCRVAVVFTVRALDPATLSSRVQMLQHELGLALADAREATFEQDRGFEATQPLGVCNVLGAWRTLDCTSVASTWPFQPGTVLHTDGADLGTTHDGSMLVRLDPFDPSLESFGGIVVAKVGSGKSYLLKLLARRLRDVEVRIVEQRTPAEYAGVAGAQTINLADFEPGERAARLRDYVSQLWATAKSDPRPRLLILDELWSLLREPALAALIEEIARIGRHHYLALYIATQQARELLDSGRAVLDNAAVRIYLKQHDRDLEDLCDAVGLSTPARRFLRSAARGQALLDVGGMIVPVDIQASAEEHQLFSTDPREKYKYGYQSLTPGTVADWRHGDGGVPSDAARDGLDRGGSDRLAGAAAVE